MKNLTKAMTITLLISLLFSCKRKDLVKTKIKEPSYNQFIEITNEERVVISKSNIRILQEKLTKKLNNNWFVFANKYSLTVYYGKSCQEKYIKYLEDTSSGALDNISRLEFFNDIGPDSICYFSGVSHYYQETKTKEEYKNRYPNNGIIKFEIIIQKEWSKERYNSILDKNDSIKAIILKNPLGKSNLGVFSDYRFWLPNHTHFGKITEEFERLPYVSNYYENSIFLVPDKPYYFNRISKVGVIDIEEQRDYALKTIAKSLGFINFNLSN